jgi:hypothetical protein
LEQLPADALLSAALRDEDAAWPIGGDANLEANVFSRAEYHGVAILLNERSQQIANWPQPIREALREHTRAHGFWELRHGHAMGEVIEALATRQIEPLFFKGTALAYALYDNPVWRTRADTDILVAPESFAEAGEALLALGYNRGFALHGEFVGHEQSYTLRLKDGSSHVIDLHRRVNNSQLLAQLFSFEELHVQSVPLPRLHPKARAVGPTHALLLACLHRLTHRNNPYYVHNVAYYDADRLIWLYDIHLFARSYSVEQWARLARIAKEKKLCFAARDGLARAQELFHSPVPEDVMDALRPGAEVVARYLQAGPITQGLIDFLALDDLGARLTFAREVVLPPAAYMRARYGRANAAWLPLLYARRAIGGVTKRLSAQSADAKPSNSEG